MKRDFAALSSQSFDVLICGGGIYGAWTAYDAALRGLRVAIIEQNDWASGTSSASTKLIHGGLRYLETGDFKLVRKALQERTMLLQAAPHRVWPLRFGVPVFAHQRLNRLQLKLGLSLYDYLADESDPSSHHRYFSIGQFGSRFPALNTTGLKGGFTYLDAQTDDARLVLELISGAMAAGACCVNYCRLSQIVDTKESLINSTNKMKREAHGTQQPRHIDTIGEGVSTAQRSDSLVQSINQRFPNKKVNGAIVRDQLTQMEYRIEARQIVIATGQWLMDDPQSLQWCRFAKGVHLVMPPLPQDEALLLTAPADGRVFFMIPWYGLTLLGTTDTAFKGDASQVTVEDNDIDYLLAAANRYLTTSWTKNDIIGRYAGVRVFKQSTQQDSTQTPSKISRDWELKTAPNGVHYAIGGKITSSRQDAAQIVDTVCAQLDVAVPCATQNRPLPWAPQENFPAWSVRMLAQAAQLGIDAESAHWLLRRHGTRTGEVFRRIETQAGSVQRIVPSLPFIDADLMQCAETEMVTHLDDLLRRRMPVLILAKLTTDDLRHIAHRIAPVLDWDDSRIELEIVRCTRYRNPS